MQPWLCHSLIYQRMEVIPNQNLREIFAITNTRNSVALVVSGWVALAPIVGESLILTYSLIVIPLLEVTEGK
jgi:hypothetical protein